MLSILWAELIKCTLTRFRYWVSTLFWIFSPFLALLPFIFQSKALSSHYTSAAFAQYAGTSNVLLFLIIGDVVATFSSVVLWRSGFDLWNECQTGTLELLFLCPLGIGAIYLGKALSYLIQGIVLTLPIFLYAYWLFSVSFTTKDILTIYGILCLVAPSLFGLSFVMGGIILRYKAYQGAITVMDEFIWLFSPVRYPVRINPFFYLMSFLVPITYAVTLARSMIISRLQISWELVFLMVFLDITFFSVGYSYLKGGERVAREKGMAASY